jgi:hypothetical protein
VISPLKLEKAGSGCISVSVRLPSVTTPPPESDLMLAPLVVALISNIAPLSTVTEEPTIEPAPDRASVPALTAVDPV